MGRLVEIRYKRNRAGTSRELCHMTASAVTAHKQGQDMIARMELTDCLKNVQLGTLISN